MKNSEKNVSRIAGPDSPAERRGILGWVFRWAVFGALVGPILYWCVGVKWGMVTLDMIVFGGPLLGATVGGAAGMFGWVLSRICPDLDKEPKKGGAKGGGPEKKKR
jgi:hypothetical protein